MRPVPALLRRVLEKKVYFFSSDLIINKTNEVEES